MSYRWLQPRQELFESFHCYEQQTSLRAFRTAYTHSDQGLVGAPELNNSVRIQRVVVRFIRSTVSFFCRLYFAVTAISIPLLFKSCSSSTHSFLYPLQYFWLWFPFAALSRSRTFSIFLVPHPMPCYLLLWWIHRTHQPTCPSTLVRLMKIFYFRNITVYHRFGLPLNTSPSRHLRIAHLSLNAYRIVRGTRLFWYVHVSDDLFSCHLPDDVTIIP